MSDFKDPLIFGPTKTQETKRSEVLNSLSPPEPEEFLDLGSSQPHQDFWWMLTKPNAFFSYFRKVEEIPSWVIWKAVLGVVVLIIAGTALSYGVALDTWSKMADLFLDDPMIARQWGALNIPVPLDSVRKIMITQGLGMGYLAVVSAPIMAFLNIFFMALSTQFFLRWVGVEKSKNKFAPLFYMKCYAGWPVILNVVPVLGGLLAFFYGIILTLKGPQNLHQISPGKSFLAVYGYFILMSVVLSLLMMALGAGFIYFLTTL